MRIKGLFWLIVLGTLLVTNGRRALGQSATSQKGPEQTLFNAEPDSNQLLVKRPIEIPDSALQVLRDTLTGGVGNCLKSRGVTPQQVPASWFLASAVHLNGPSEIDLVVLPDVPSLSDPKNPGGCLLAAHGGRFWVLGPGIASEKYDLLLATEGLGLEILNSRTNRYRDIEIGEEGATLIYKYSVQQYQLAEKRDETLQ